MFIQDLRLRVVADEVRGTTIHGQGAVKRYCFIELHGDNKILFAEIYPGLYSISLVRAALLEIKKRVVGKAFFSGEEISVAMHIPFISGAGVYHAVASCVQNCFSHSEGVELGSAGAIPREYLSGGTVKTDIAQMEKEVCRATESKYLGYKVRLDYRNILDSKQKIEFLNNCGISYAVDFICNTNYSVAANDEVLKLIDLMDPSEVLWIEEPCVPHLIHRNISFLNKIRSLGFTVAFGESLTSPLELGCLEGDEAVGLLQLDATINGSYQQLVHFMNEATTCLGLHNWGSIITSIQNASLLKNTSHSCFFEIPVYETDFDIAVAKILGIDRSKPSTWTRKVLLDESLLSVMTQYEDAETSDFRWT